MRLPGGVVDSLPFANQTIRVDTQSEQVPERSPDQRLRALVESSCIEEHLPILVLQFTAGRIRPHASGDQCRIWVVQ